MINTDVFFGLNPFYYIIKSFLNAKFAEWMATSALLALFCFARRFQIGVNSIVRVILWICWILWILCVWWVWTIGVS